MANSKAHRDAEDWVRENRLHLQFNTKFHKKRLSLRTGGVFEFDAVSEDGRIAISISTSGGETTGQKKASPKMNKIRSDALFLLLADVDQRYIMFTEPKMFALCEEQIRLKRFPTEVQILLETLPDELEDSLVKSRRFAAEVINPRSKNDA